MQVPRGTQELQATTPEVMTLDVFYSDLINSVSHNSTFKALLDEGVVSNNEFKTARHNQESRVSLVYSVVKHDRAKFQGLINVFRLKNPQVASNLQSTFLSKS